MPSALIVALDIRTYFPHFCIDAFYLIEC